MKKLNAVTAILMFLIMGTTYAQQGRNMTPEARAEMQTSHMKQELALGAEQITAVQAINLEFANKQKAVWDNGEKPYKAKMLVLMDEKADAFKEVLSPEQFTQWETMKAERQNLKQGRKGSGKGNGRKGRGNN